MGAQQSSLESPHEIDKLPEIGCDDSFAPTNPAQGSHTSTSNAQPHQTSHPIGVQASDCLPSTTSLPVSLTDCPVRRRLPKSTVSESIQRPLSALFTFNSSFSTSRDLPQERSSKTRFGLLPRRHKNVSNGSNTPRGIVMVHPSSAASMSQLDRIHYLETQEKGLSKFHSCQVLREPEEELKILSRIPRFEPIRSMNKSASLNLATVIDSQPFSDMFRVYEDHFEDASTRVLRKQEIITSLQRKVLKEPEEELKILSRIPRFEPIRSVNKSTSLNWATLIDPQPVEHESQRLLQLMRNGLLQTNPDASKTQIGAAAHTFVAGAFQGKLISEDLEDLRKMVASCASCLEHVTRQVEDLKINLLDPCGSTFDSMAEEK